MKIIDQHECAVVENQIHQNQKCPIANKCMFCFSELDGLACRDGACTQFPPWGDL
jgi:hypothetical protein